MSARPTPKERAARDKLKARAKLVKLALERETRLGTALDSALKRTDKRASKLDCKLRGLRMRLHMLRNGE